MGIFSKEKKADQCGGKALMKKTVFAFGRIPFG
jgi:hypothetical protein